jgi:cell division initiation protein
MRLSAMDIRRQQFAIKMFRGLDPQEVDAFLEEIADDWEQLHRENNLLKEQLTTLEEQKKATDEQNRSLQDTLVTAQKIAEEFRESSKRAADILLREAELQAEKFLQEKRQELSKLTTDVEATKQLRRQAADQLLNTLKDLRSQVEQRLVDGP